MVIIVGGALLADQGGILGYMPSLAYNGLLYNYIGIDTFRYIEQVAQESNCQVQILYPIRRRAIQCTWRRKSQHAMKILYNFMHSSRKERLP